MMLCTDREDSRQGRERHGAYFGSPHSSALHPGSWRSSVRGTKASGSSACMHCSTFSKGRWLF